MKQIRNTEVKSIANGYLESHTQDFFDPKPVFFFFYMLHIKINYAMAFKINHTNYYMQRNPKATMQVFTEGIHLTTWLAKHNT